MFERKTVIHFRLTNLWLSIWMCEIRRQRNHADRRYKCLCLTDDNHKLVQAMLEGKWKFQLSKWTKRVINWNKTKQRTTEWEECKEESKNGGEQIKERLERMMRVNFLNMYMHKSTQKNPPIYIHNAVYILHINTCPHCYMCIWTCVSCVCYMWAYRMGRLLSLTLVLTPFLPLKCHISVCDAAQYVYAYTSLNVVVVKYHKHRQHTFVYLECLLSFHTERMDEMKWEKWAQNIPVSTYLL